MSYKYNEGDGLVNHLANRGVRVLGRRVREDAGNQYFVYEFETGDEYWIWEQNLTDMTINEDATAHLLEVVDNLAATGEVRITSETGGMKGSKPSQLGWVDPQTLLLLGEAAGYGAAKYGEGDNFRNGFDWRLSYDALLRHLLSFWAGEDYDPETGLPHMVHAAWHGLTLTSFLINDAGTDTRWTTKAAQKPETVEIKTHNEGKVVRTVGAA